MNQRAETGNKVEETENTDIPVSLDELKATVISFIHWVARNDFTDPEHMLVCAEWFNLCGSVDMPMLMAGSEYAERCRLYQESIRAEELALDDKGVIISKNKELDNEG